MNREEHRKKLKGFIGKENPGISHKQMDEALYALNETNTWPDDVGSVSAEQAVMCWRLVERLRKTEFPEELGM